MEMGKSRSCGLREEAEETEKKEEKTNSRDGLNDKLSSPQVFSSPS